MPPPSPHLQVIALISGGKDSILSILQCQKLGHEIVALANLSPLSSPAKQDSDTQDLDEEDLGPQDLNSHLYQTAGHTLLPFYEQALGIPLYRREITGQASRLEREYDASYLSTQQDGGSEHDETEDLFYLLQDILNQHPDANAVCSGAILSNYQRSRIEDVCGRLGLRSLAFLWQMACPLPGVSEDCGMGKRAEGLLDYFAEVGLDARIVKVASGGLDEGFLWGSLRDARVRGRIKSAVRRFGGSVVGEGGEFETVVLDGPRTLFRGRIVVEDGGYCVRRGQGGEAWLDVDASKVYVRQHDADEGLLDMSRCHVEDAEAVSPASRSLSPAKELPQIQSERSNEQVNLSDHCWNSYITWYGDLLLLGNIHSSIEAETSEQEMQLIVDEIKETLIKENLTPANLIFTTIILRNMDDFEKINAVYKTLFSRPLPPARVTIAAGNQMPFDVSILLSCIAQRDSQSIRSGIHVQSISFWAPANIGPYSQAISIPVSTENNQAKVVFIAGQIPLVPETMLLAEYHGTTELEEFKQQALLSLRHARRIGSVMDVCWFSYAVAFICAEDKTKAFERANIAYNIWKSLHEELNIVEDLTEESEGLDVWDIEYGGQRSFVDAADRPQSVPSFESLRSKHSEDKVPGFLAIHIDRLPRDAKIEWQTIGFAGGTVDVKAENPYTNICELFQYNAANCCTSVTVIAAPSDKVQEISGSDYMPEGLITVYGSTTNLLNTSLPNASVVPCHRVWGLIDGELVEISHGIVKHQFGSVG